MTTSAEVQKAEGALRSLPLHRWRSRLKLAKTKTEALKLVADCNADCANIIIGKLGDGPLADLTLKHIQSGTKFDPKVERGHPSHDPGNMRAMMEAAFTDGGLDFGDELDDWLSEAIAEAHSNWMLSRHRAGEAA